MKKIQLTLILLSVLSVTGAAEKKTLTNTDVIRMVKADLPEATVLLAIQANPHDFDPSVDALIELKTAGVPPKVIEAMLQPAAPAAPAVPSSADPAPAATAEQKTRPYAFVVTGGGERRRLQSTPFKIIATKAKGNSVGMLLAESAVTDVAGSAIMNGAFNIIAANGGQLLGTIGGAAMGITSMIGTKVFKSDEVTFTYVCALGSKQSATSLAAEGVRFELHYADVFGADPDEFEPVIVKVSPTPKNWRLVAAVKAKKSEFDQGQARPIEFIEERVAVTAKKLGRGHVEIDATAPLAPGEYAVVLRPLLKTKAVALHEVEQEQAEGIVLRAVWDFSIAAVPAAPTALD